MNRIARSQLELLKLDKGKGFTVTDAEKALKAPKQSVYQRVDAALELKWLSAKLEPGKGARERYRFRLTAAGAAIVKKKWTGKGRFLAVANGKKNGKH